MSHRSSRLTVAGWALLLGLALGLAVRPTPQAAEEPARAQFLAIALHQANVVLRHQGQKMAEIRADRVEVSRDLRYATFAGNSTVVMFNAGEEIFRLRGSKIVLDRQTTDVTIKGPVEVTSADGGRLSAGAASWIHASQQLVFSQQVTMTLGEQQLQADHLTIDVGQQMLDFSGRADIAFRLEGTKP